jgi:hypothetical protein
MATVTIRYGGSTVTAKVTAVHISSTALAPNTLTGYNASNYPASPEVTYYFSAESPGQTAGRSQTFAPNGGKGQWEGWIPPAAGTWTIHVRKVSDNSSVANTTLSAV